MRSSDTLRRPAGRDMLPGRSRTRVPLHYVICVPGQCSSGLLCWVGCWGTGPLFCMGTGQEQSLQPCQSISRATCTNKKLGAKVELRFLCRGPHKLMSQWMDCCFARAPHVCVESPGFPWESLNSGGWRSWHCAPCQWKKPPNIAPLKLIF